MALKKFTRRKKKKDPEIFMEKIDEDTYRILDISMAELIDKGCELNKEKKQIEKDLAEIKDKLDLKAKGDYITPKNTLKITVVKNKSDIDPLDLYNIFKTKKITSKFWSCVKVAIAPLKKQLPEAEIEALQIELDPTIKYFF